MQLTKNSFLRSRLEPAFHRRLICRQTAGCWGKLSAKDAFRLSASLRIALKMSQIRSYLSMIQSAVPHSHTQSPPICKAKSIPRKIPDPNIYYNAHILGHKKKNICKLASSKFTNGGKVSTRKTTFHSNSHFFNSGPGDGNPSMNAPELGASLKTRHPKRTGYAQYSDGPHFLYEKGQGVVTTISFKTEPLHEYLARMQGANRLFRRPVMQTSQTF